MNRLVRKFSFEGSAKSRLITGFCSTGFLLFFHRLADFFRGGGGDIGGGEPAKKALTVSLFELRGSGALFFSSLFIVILKRLAGDLLRGKGGLEDVAMMQPNVANN